MSTCRVHSECTSTFDVRDRDYQDLFGVDFTVGVKRRLYHGDALAGGKRVPRLVALLSTTDYNHKRVD